MEELELLPFGHPMLKQEPKLFDFETDDANKLKSQLITQMYKLKGVGLSANQVGIDKKVFVMGAPGVKEKAIFNPILLSVSKTGCTIREGCLSYPGLWLNLTRPDSCILQFQDENNETHIEEFGGISARIVLHEFDHMIGQNFTMRASKLKIARALKHLDKKVKEYYYKGIN